MLPHQPWCPYLRNPEVTCACLRELIPFLPNVPRESAVRWWGVAGVRQMLAAGLLKLGAGGYWLRRDGEP